MFVKDTTLNYMFCLLDRWKRPLLGVVDIISTLQSFAILFRMVMKLNQNLEYIITY